MQLQLVTPYMQLQLVGAQVGRQNLTDPHQLRESLDSAKVQISERYSSTSESKQLPIILLQSFTLINDCFCEFTYTVMVPKT